MHNDSKAPRQGLDKPRTRGYCRPVKPYYQSQDRAVTVYHAPWEDAWPHIDHKAVRFVHADPPYGARTDTKNSRRGGPNSKAIAPGRDYPPIQGDDRPFDPSPILALEKTTVLWGANYYAHMLPPSASWLSWLKRGIGSDGLVESDCGSDEEFAWTNFTKFPAGSSKCFPHTWRGLCRASEVSASGSRTFHPTQKPKALCAWVFGQAMWRGKLNRGDTIFVPFGGTMPEILPAMALGCPVIVCETERQYVDDALAVRLGVGQGSGATVAQDDARDDRQARLFEAR